MTLWEEDEKLILLLLFVFTTKNWVTKVIRYLFTYGMSFLNPENPKSPVRQSPVTNNTFRHTHPKINSTNKDKIREYMVWWGNIYSASIQLFTLLNYIHCLTFCFMRLPSGWGPMAENQWFKFNSPKYHVTCHSKICNTSQRYIQLASDPCNNT